jgi:hypothetical protein
MRVSDLILISMNSREVVVTTRNNIFIVNNYGNSVDVDVGEN